MSDQFSTYKPILQKAGLNQNEADLYLYLLEHGKSSIQQLLQDTGIKRGNLYHLLYSLRDQDLVQQTVERKKLHFQLNDPYFLRDLITKQRAEVDANARQVENIIPSLLSAFTLTAEKPSVRSYEGPDGLKEVYNELNSSKTSELLLMRSVYDSDNETVATIINHQIKEQVKLGIHTKALTPLMNESLDTLTELDPKRLVERRLVAQNQFSLNSQLLVWNDTVAIVSLRKQLIATVIENKDIAQSMCTLFEYIWNASQSFHEQALANRHATIDAPNTD